MCQFNYTIVKSKKSVSYLRNHGHSCLNIFPGGYKAFGGNKPGYCDCGSMVGSRVLHPESNGANPFKLPADNSEGTPEKQTEGLSLPYIRSIREFLYYRRIFKRLLEFEPYLCFTHIFDRPGELTTVKTLRLSELKCRDLAQLLQDQVLKIRR